MTGFTRHRKSRLVIANFSGFEADLLRSLASQLVELLRNERAVPIHVDGRSVVSTGSREEMERDVQAMHEYGLWATMQKADA